MKYKNRLQMLLATNPDETIIQSFFETNTVALTGRGYFLGNCLIRKFPLGRDHITDFAYINPMSGRCFIWLIEIESPSKIIFTVNDAFTEKLNQALQQVRDWMSWCQRNQQVLRDQLEPLRYRSGDSIMSYVARGKLIFGRRKELNNQRRIERWQGLVENNHPFIHIRTYDGVAQEADDYLTHLVDPMDPICVAYQNRAFQPLKLIK